MYSRRYELSTKYARSTQNLGNCSKSHHSKYFYFVIPFRYKYLKVLQMALNMNIPLKRHFYLRNSNLLIRCCSIFTAWISAGVLRIKTAKSLLPSNLVSPSNKKKVLWVLHYKPKGILCFRQKRRIMMVHKKKPAKFFHHFLCLMISVLCVLSERFHWNPYWLPFPILFNYDWELFFPFTAPGLLERDFICLKYILFYYFNLLFFLWWRHFMGPGDQDFWFEVLFHRTWNIAALRSWQLLVLKWVNIAGLRFKSYQKLYPGNRKEFFLLKNCFSHFFNYIFNKNTILHHLKIVPVYVSVQSKQETWLRNLKMTVRPDNLWVRFSLVTYFLHTFLFILLYSHPQLI